jgi:hypothetical protein
MCLAGPLAGCASYSGHSGTCRYGLKGGSSGNHCYNRPKPSDALAAQAMSTAPLARSVEAWKRRHGAAVVSSVGVNRWAETTFAVPRTGDDRLVTFDVHGRPTSGDDGYASHPRDPFRVGNVRPEALARVIRTVRADQPDTTLLAAVLTVDPFANELTWHVTMISSKASSSLVYRAAPDGRRLCHGRDPVKDALEPAREIPSCPESVLSLY